MKSLKLFLFLAVSSVIIASCGLLDSTGGSYMTAKIGDKEFESGNLLTIYAATPDTSAANISSLTGSTGGLSPETISFTLYNVTGPGTYEFGDGILNAVVYNEGASQEETYATGTSGTSGSIIITNLTDDIVEGTFSFVAEKASASGNSGEFIEVTDGEFVVER